MSVANRQEFISKIAKISFYLAVVIEVMIVLVDKSAYTNPIEGRLFQVTFVLCLVTVLLTKYSLREYVTIALFLFLGAVSYFITERNEIIRGVMLIAACKNIDMRKCMKLIFYMTLTGCGLIVILSVLGVGGVVSLTQDYGRGQVEVRYTLGMGHPNALQCMVWALTTLGVYLYHKKLKWGHYLLVLLINVFFFVLTDSKTGLLVGAFTIFLFALFSFLEKRNRGKQICAAGSIAICAASILGSVAIAAGAMSLWRRNVQGVPGKVADLLAFADRFLTGRIASLIGNTHHEGVMETWRVFSGPESVYYFDLGWVRLFYWYGVIPAVIAIGVLFVFLIYFYKKEMFAEMAVITAFSLYTVIEAHAVSVYMARNYVLFIIGMYWCAVLYKANWERRR